MSPAKFLSIQYLDICLSERDVEYLMWNETAYPFAGFRTLIRQLRSAARAWRRGLSRCMCGQPEAYCRCRSLLPQETTDEYR